MKSFKQLLSAALVLAALITLPNLAAAQTATATPTSTPTPASNASWGTSPQSFPVNKEGDMQWRAATIVKPAVLPLIIGVATPAAAGTPATVQSYTPTDPKQSVYTWATHFSCSGGSAAATVTITGLLSTAPITMEETTPFDLFLPWYGEPATEGLPVSYSVTGGSGSTCSAWASYFIM